MPSDPCKYNVKDKTLAASNSPALELLPSEKVCLMYNVYLFLNMFHYFVTTPFKNIYYS